MGAARIIKKIKIAFFNQIVPKLQNNRPIISNPIIIDKIFDSGTMGFKLRPSGFKIRIGNSRFILIFHDLGKRTYKGAEQIRMIRLSFLRFQGNELKNLWWIYR